MEVRFQVLLAGCWLMSVATGAAGPVRVGTYNVENYVMVPTGTRPAKTEASKARVVEAVKRMAADVLGLVEMGGAGAVEDLRGRSGRSGLPYPYSAHITGFDTQIQIAVLSRFPIRTVRAHTNDTFLLGGRRMRVSRGFLEADIEVGRGSVLTVFVAHLKSRRTSAEADEAEWRREEARLLRGKVEARIAADPRALVVVLGDFNDTKDSDTIRVLLGRGRHRLVDTRPSEQNGDTGYTPNPRWEPRTATWTHYYGVEDTYSRVDYILLHPNLSDAWVAEESRVVTLPDWGLASDHRPLVVTLRLP